VLVIGWQALPVLAAIRCGLLPRPEKILVMACFVHGMRARRILDRLWRWLKFPGMGFITFSQGEAQNLIDTVGMAPADVHFHLWRQDLYGRADSSMIGEDGSVFAGGYSNRDYDLLLRALKDVPVPLTIVAAERNEITVSLRPEQTTVLRDLPEAEFEALLAKSSVVAMPLHSQGEACGQSVLLRVLRNGKPLVTTRHESIEAYLGKDYPGFVKHNDEEALRQGIVRAIDDASYRMALSTAIRTASERLDRADGPGKEIENFLAA
jgi:glycosyltransferase involved in cell wall biosynthesis